MHLHSCLGSPLCAPFCHNNTYLPHRLLWATPVISRGALSGAQDRLTVPSRPARGSLECACSQSLCGSPGWELSFDDDPGLKSTSEAPSPTLCLHSGWGLAVPPPGRSVSDSPQPHLPKRAPFYGCTPPDQGCCEAPFSRTQGQDGSFTDGCQETGFVLGSWVFDLLVRKQTEGKKKLYKYAPVIMGPTGVGTPQ